MGQGRYYSGKVVGFAGLGLTVVELSGDHSTQVQCPESLCRICEVKKNDFGDGSLIQRKSAVLFPQKGTRVVVLGDFEENPDNGTRAFFPYSWGPISTGQEAEVLSLIEKEE